MLKQKNSFIVRGGIWVLAQIPLMLVVLLIPLWYGAGHFVPAGMWSLAGMMLTVSGFFLTVWALKSLGEALTPFPQPLDGVTLNQRGPYRWMRHPIYSGVMLAGFGWALWWLSAAGALCALVLALFFDRKAAHEEIWLRQKYPDYPDYTRRVKKFIPGVY
jgi:protein-S-isoprenylcysteine O-methyltransferase Ste14